MNLSISRIKLVREGLTTIKIICNARYKYYQGKGVQLRLTGKQKKIAIDEVKHLKVPDLFSQQIIKRKKKLTNKQIKPTKATGKS